MQEVWDVPSPGQIFGSREFCLEEFLLPMAKDALD
jgi:hypothetical protein